MDSATACDRALWVLNLRLAFRLSGAHVMRKEQPAARHHVEEVEDQGLEFSMGPLGCGYVPVPHRKEAAHFSGTLLTLLFDWIPKPCATPLLLRWYGSYFQHIITAAVSPPPERSSVPHLSCRHRHFQLCYAKVLRRHKGFSNYLFLGSDVFMRPQRLLGFPLDRPWLLASGGYSPRSYGDDLLDRATSRPSDEALMKWWQGPSAVALKRLYVEAAGGPRVPQASAPGVANIPAIMGKYFVSLAESLSEVRGDLAQSMIFDLWEVIPGTPKTWLVAENDTLWMRGPGTRQRLYEDHLAAFTHPLWLSGPKEQKSLDIYLLEHEQDF
ncbi:unnamed protein product [Durusdinium trenchii]|uniref:Uncharacterized protein n=2 Tax=Durusdinium trenchii TaxID=1381693 RepID=A0ABP0QL40_9DINO